MTLPIAHCALAFEDALAVMNGTERCLIKWNCPSRYGVYEHAGISVSQARRWMCWNPLDKRAYGCVEVGRILESTSKKKKKRAFLFFFPHSLKQNLKSMCSLEIKGKIVLWFHTFQGIETPLLKGEKNLKNLPFLATRQCTENAELSECGKAEYVSIDWNFKVTEEQWEKWLRRFYRFQGAAGENKGKTGQAATVGVGQQSRLFHLQENSGGPA